MQRAYAAFIESVKTYPFHQESVLRVIRTSAIQTAFDSCQSLTQIGATIDRATYMGVCELLRDPSDVSAKSWFTPYSDGIGRLWNDEDNACIVGAILERQAYVLLGSQWKTKASAAAYRFLTDALRLYCPEKRPLRRSRVLLKLLELRCFTGTNQSNEHSSVHEIGLELQHLLASKVRGVGH